jgi:hypothetical protein
MGVVYKAEDADVGLVCVLAFLLAAGLASAQVAPAQISQPQAAQSAVPNASLTADEIMVRVAANQSRSEELRKEYVYKQHIHIATHKPKSRMMREENADYDVVPQADGVKKQLRLLTGHYWKKDQYVDFQGDPDPEPKKTDEGLIHNLRSFEPMPMSSTADADLIRYLRNYLLDDNSKDGLARSLFPLTFEQQRNYTFRLLGQEIEANRNVYHIAFSPRDEPELSWTGEAFIDAAEFQPVRVFTKMARPIPLLVRTMWFDLAGLGFNVVYKRQADGVWFPWIFGTEFRMHTGAVFYFNRDVAISLENSDFKHSHLGASRQQNAVDLGNSQQ